MVKIMSKFRENFLAVVLLLFAVRLGLPQYIKFALYPAVAFFGVWALVNFVRSKGWRKVKLVQLGIFTPWILLLLYYAISLVFTPDKQVGLLKDAFNILVLAAFIVSVFLAGYTKGELVKSLQRFGLLTVVFGALFALAGIVKLVLQLYGVRLGFLNIEGFGYPAGTSLSADDNFFTLLCLLGVVFVLPYAFSQLSKTNRVWLQVAVYLLVVNIFLATSRRGLIIGSLFLTGAVLLWVVSWMHKTERLSCFRRNTTLLILFIGLTFGGYYYFVFRVSALERNQWLANSRFNKEEFNTYLNLLTLNGQSIFKGNAQYTDVSDKIWQTTFDPRYPYTGWARGNYELVKKFPGVNAEIVPKGALGARIDKNAKAYTGKDYAYYLSKLFDGELAEDKRCISSVYCFVSEDFNGSSVRLITRNDARGLRDWFYDLGKKGTWQKLQNSFYGDSGRFSTSIYLVNENSQSFDSLQGHVIFAYPQLKEIEFNPKDPLTWASNQFVEVSELHGFNATKIPQGTKALKPIKADIKYREKDSTWYYGAGLFRYHFQDTTRVVPSIYVYVSTDFNGDEVYLNAGGRIYGFTKCNYNLELKGTWQKLYLTYSMFEGESWVDYGYRKKVTSPIDTVKGYVLFANPDQMFLKFDSKKPLTWAGTNFTSITTLTGKGSEQIPMGSIGLKVDKNSQSKSYKGLVYTTNSIIYLKLVNSLQRLKTSIYVYASPDFNGQNLRLAGSTKNIGGYWTSNYNMDNKGTWQKLTINNWGEAGEEYYSTTYFELPNAKDFKNLKGYVIFAHPDFKLLYFDPKNPESYTSSAFIRDYPLVGNNSDIVPQGVAGARFNRTTEGKVWRDFYHSTTLFCGVQAEPGDSVFASVYCFVSPDFNGNDVRLELRGPVKGQTLSRFNFNERGRWVKLEAKAIADKEGIVSGIFLFMQNNVKDFSALKGYVTFAYPQLYVKPKVGLTEVISDYKINLAGFAGLGLQLGTSVDSTGSDGEFKFSMADDGFAGPRVDRWRYAIYLYRHEYTPLQKIFGGGFGYTRKFATQFFPDDQQRDYDYPHNPFLSILLYSGMLGLLISVWFIYQVFRLYWSHRKVLWPFGLAFLASFFYAFFSSNNFFEPAIFGILAFIPFYYKYLSVVKD